MTTLSNRCGGQPCKKLTVGLPTFLLLLWLASARAVPAQPTAGHYAYPSVSGAGNSIWDVSGNYMLSENITIRGVDYPAWIDINITQDLQGKLHGAGMLSGLIDGDPLDGNYTVAGSVRTIGANTMVTMTLHASGTGSIDGDTRHFVLSLRYNLQIDSFGLMMVGQSKGTLTIPGLGQAPVGSSAALPLPAGMDGSWRLSLDVQSGKNNGSDTSHAAKQKLNGSASIRLSNDRVISCPMNVNYTGASAHSRVRISGPGATISLNGFQSRITLSDFAGKVLGQKVRAAFEPAIAPSSAPNSGTGGIASGRLTGSKYGCTGWSIGVSGEDFSNTTTQSSFQYDIYGNVSREYGTIRADNTGHTYSYDARYSYSFGGCFSSVTLTVSGGLLRPYSQSITF